MIEVVNRTEAISAQNSNYVLFRCRLARLSLTTKGIKQENK